MIQLPKVQRVVLKLGTKILTSGIGHLDEDRIGQICKAVHELRKKNIEVMIVSSGAVGLGMGRLQLKKRPSDLASKQTCAAVGQSILTETWQKGFTQYNHLVAQVLLTRDDLRARHRHVAAQNLLNLLLKKNIIPIINENDCISTEEIKFGDNDILSALVASITKSDLLIILSTAPGLIDMRITGDLKENRRDRGSSQFQQENIIPYVEKITAEIEQLASGTTDPTSVGGMITKILAGRVATLSGCIMFIGSGYEPAILYDVLEGCARGTYFKAKTQAQKLQSKKRWLAFFSTPQGSVQVNAQAVPVIVNEGASLLAKGIIKVQGTFKVGDIVDVMDSLGQPFARGITQFSSDTIQKILGQSTETIRQQFPYQKKLEVIHRDYLVMLE